PHYRHQHHRHGFRRNRSRPPTLLSRRALSVKNTLTVRLNLARDESSPLTLSVGWGERRREPSSLFKNTWFAAWGHAAYKFSSRIGTHCRPGAITGRLFQRAPVTTLVCGFGVSRDQSLRIPPAPRSRTPSVVAADV